MPRLESLRLLNSARVTDARLGMQGVDGVDQLARRTREAIELLNDQRVALMDRFHRFEQGWSIDCGTRDMLSEDLFRIRLRSATSGSARF